MATYEKGIETDIRHLRPGNVTKEGVEFLNGLVEFFDESEKDVYRLPEEWSHLKISPRGGRSIIALPDEFVNEHYIDSLHDTHYVAKISYAPETEIFHEIRAWQSLHDHSTLACHLAPVDAWGEDFTWLVMRRIEDCHPYRIPHINLSQTLEPNDFRDLFEQHGWTLDDADENTGYDHLTQRSCLFDYGGLAPIDPKPDYDQAFQDAMRESESVTLAQMEERGEDRSDTSS